VQRKINRPVIVIATAASFVAAIVVFVACGFWWFWPSGPKETKEGQTWSNRELVEHLKSKGIALEATAAPANAKMFSQNFEAVIVLARKDERDTSIFGMAGFGKGVVYAMKFSSVEIAKREVSTAKDDYLANDNSLFSWGRFVFIGDADFLDDIRQALAGKTIPPRKTTQSVKATEGVPNYATRRRP